MSQEYTFVPSVLHVVAQEIDLTQDFASSSDKTINDLLNEEKNKTKNSEETSPDQKETSEQTTK